MKHHRGGWRYGIGLILTIIGVLAFVLMPLVLLLCGCSSDMVGLTRAMTLNVFQSHSDDDKTDSTHTTYGKIPSPKDK